MKPLRSILTAGLALAVFSTTALRAETFPIFEDAAGSAVTNTIARAAGAAKTLAVSARSNAFINFSVGSAGLDPATVTQARLIIFLPRASAAGTLSIKTLTSGFTETITTRTIPAPTIGATLDTIDLAQIPLRGDFFISDITAQVQAWLSDPSTEFGIAITSDGVATATLASKEGAGSGHPAFIEVDVNRGGGDISGNDISGSTLTISGLTTLANTNTNFLTATGLSVGSDGIKLPGGALPTPNPAFVGTPGNSLTFSHTGTSEDFIGYKDNTFFFRDGLGGPEEEQPNVDIGGSLIVGGVRLQTFGEDNIFLGADAGNFSLSAADRNVGVGNTTLQNLTTGGKNTALGHGAMRSTSSGFTTVAVGTDALAAFTSGANTTAVGVSTLEVATSAQNNTGLGFVALLATSTGGGNTGVGAFAGTANTTGTNNTAVGRSANFSSGTLTNATAIGANAVVDASNKVRIGNGSVTLIEGQVDFTFTSDRTKKENFLRVDGREVLEKIRGFELTSWNYIGHDPKQFRHYGVMAQDFHAAFGEDGIGTIGSPTTVNGGDMAGIMMSAIKELANQNAELRAELVALKAADREREARLSRLESALDDRAARTVRASLDLK